MQFIEKIKTNKLLQIILIIVLLPLIIFTVYLINLSGVYVGTFIRRILTGFKC